MAWHQLTDASLIPCWRCGGHHVRPAPRLGIYRSEPLRCACGAVGTLRPGIRASAAWHAKPIATHLRSQGRTVLGWFARCTEVGPTPKRGQQTTITVQAGSPPVSVDDMPVETPAHATRQAFRRRRNTR